MSKYEVFDNLPKEEQDEIKSFVINELRRNNISIRFEIIGIDIGDASRPYSELIIYSKIYNNTECFNLYYNAPFWAEERNDKYLKENKDRLEFSYGRY